MGQFYFGDLPQNVGQNSTGYWHRRDQQLQDGITAK